MIILAETSNLKYTVKFTDGTQKDFPLVSGEYLKESIISDGQNMFAVYIGLGKEGLDIRRIKEAVCFAVSFMEKQKLREYAMDISGFFERIGPKSFFGIAEGIYTGIYSVKLPGGEKKQAPTVYLYGIKKENMRKASIELKKAVNLAKEQDWVRDMVNAPGNMLRPMNFAREITEHIKNLPIECEVFVYSKLNAMGFHALTAVGKSSDNPPCMLVMRYCGGKEYEPSTGLVGKGVTCDTGGYCLKSASSMMGIKGDMAGGAAVAAAVTALAKNEIKRNVTGVIPMCENRINASSLVPGDVISSYSGKKIEICNTDAEGRLILADAVSYAVKDEKVSRIVDIATLTGSVVGSLGFSTAGILSDDEEFYHEFMEKSSEAGERYWRFPIYEEQKRMIKSKIADIKNMGKNYCGTITAGLFIQAFAEGKPWIHLDIAGTAWCDEPLYKGQPVGATGAGTASLYSMFSGGE